MARAVIRGCLLATACAAVPTALPAQTTYPPNIGNPSYPIPYPIDSTLPVEGFRTRTALQTRLMDLSIAHDFIGRHLIGETREGHDIEAYVIGDADDLAVDGTREPGAMVNGTIHAREWCSPEIVVQLIEHFAASNGTDPVVSYLVQQNHLAVVPILNIDGFDQTQRFPNQQYNSIEGRQRRKNMRLAGGGLVDHDITTTGDNSHGIDLNRNLSVGFGAGGSGTTTNIQYRGPSAFSEPETQALRDSVAALFDDPSSLRFYADVHGAIPALFVVFHGSEAADMATYVLGERLESVYTEMNGRGIDMLYVCPPSGDCVADALGIPSFDVDPPIGATDEYHGFTYSIPSFTIEYPTPNYREAGSGDTFILPADEVAQTVLENREALLLGFYFAAGPPVVERVRVWRDANADNQIDGSEIMHDSAWSADDPATTRSRSVAENQPVISGAAHRVILQFNKPMRRMAAGVAVQWTGQSVALQPTVAIKNGTTTLANVLPLAAGWQSTPESGTAPGYARFAGDTWIGTIEQGALAFDGSAMLSVAAADAYGHAVDENPATVADWDDGWQGFETASGADTQTTLLVDPAPQTEPESWRVY